MNAIKSIARLILLAAYLALAGCGGGGTEEEPVTVTAKAATLAPPSNTTIFSNGTIEVGRFALSTQKDTSLKKVQMSSIGTLANLTDVVGMGSLTLWDVATGKMIAVATTTVSGKTVMFEGMSHSILKDSTTNLKVILTTLGDVSPNYGKTLQFTLVSIETDAPTHMVGLPIVMKEYRVGVTPPTVSLVGSSLTSNGILATIRVTNTDQLTDVRLDMMAFRLLIAPSNSIRTLTGALCLREIGSVNGCQGGTPASIVGTSGSVVNVSLFGRSDVSNTLPKDGGALELEVYLEGGPLWVGGDMMQLELQSIRVVDASGTTTHAYASSTILTR